MDNTFADDLLQLIDEI